MKAISKFFNDEYTQQAQYVNFSKIANVISGNKVTMQKVQSTIITENINTWQKVEVVSSLTALKTLYLGGSSNIDGVITNMGATYTGSNNLTLIESKGDFGGRLNNLASASRYIFTKKSKNFDKYFNKEDLNVLPRYNFEGQDIEYQFFTFNIPMILVNGTQGLGSGFASYILPRNIVDIEEALINKLENPNKPLVFNATPYFEGFDGPIVQGDTSNQWVISGKIKRLPRNKLEILQVPISESYKSYIKKLDKLEESGIITRYEDRCDPKNDTFNFLVTCNTAFMKKTDPEILKILKLVTTVSENYTLNDENNVIKVFENTNDIFEHYYNIKLLYLQKRKDYLIEKLLSEITVDNSKYLFIKAIVSDNLIINKRKKQDIVNDLDTNQQFVEILKREESYDYLLNMLVISLTEERMNKLLEQIKLKKLELSNIKLLSVETMWLNDLK